MTQRKRISFLVPMLGTLLLAVAPAPMRSAAEEDYDAIFDKARQNYRKSNYPEALKLYQKANNLKGKTSLECLLGAAETYVKLRDYKNALKTCDQMIQLGGDDAGYLVKAWNMRGNALFNSALFHDPESQKSAFQQAETAFREVLKINPGLNMARYNLGLALIRLNRVDEGIAELQTYIQNADERDTADRARKIIENPNRIDENYGPDFSLVTADGEYLSSDELRGKVILLDFWIIRNDLSLKAGPFLTKLADKYKNEGIIPISVNCADEEQAWRSYIAQYKPNWKHVRDKNSKLQRDLFIGILPSYILIDHEGIIRYRSAETASQLEKEIKKALKAATAYNMQPRYARQTPAAAQPGSVPPSIPTHAAARPAVRKEYPFRIPKPVIEVTLRPVTTSNNSISLQSNYLFTMQIKNWASMPDDLFMQIKDLPPCSGNQTGMATYGFSPQPNPTRMEITLWNEQGLRLKTVCGPSRPEILQNMMFSVSRSSDTSKVYVIVKDRLTGNSVQSDIVPLP